MGVRFAPDTHHIRDIIELGAKLARLALKVRDETLTWCFS
jgi:hypothetical protein